MANIQSKSKNVRKTKELTVYNKQIINCIKTMSKSTRSAIIAKNKLKISIIVPKYISILDKAAKRGIIHANKSNRNKSSAMKSFMRLG